MAKKKSKSKKSKKSAKRQVELPVGQDARTEANGVLFGWREPRKRALCRPSSAYRFLADLNSLATPSLSSEERYLYLGTIPNRPEHCAVIEVSTGRVLTANHPEDFEELPAGEL